MPQVQVWAEIPVRYELACDTLRVPRKGEYFINNCGGVSIATGDYVPPSVIVIPAWKWPEWLKAPWIAMDKGGNWAAHRSKPFIREGFWDSDDELVLSDEYFNFNPPPCSDWKQSLRSNPND